MCNNANTLFLHTCTHTNTKYHFGEASTSIPRGNFVWPQVSWGVRFVHCLEVKVCPYFRGRNVLNVCYKCLGVGSLSVLWSLRLSVSWSVRYQRFTVTVITNLTMTEISMKLQPNKLYFIYTIPFPSIPISPCQAHVHHSVHQSQCIRQTAQPCDGRSLSWCRHLVEVASLQ